MRVGRVLAYIALRRYWRQCCGSPGTARWMCLRENLGFFAMSQLLRTCVGCTGLGWAWQYTRLSLSLSAHVACALYRYVV